MLNTLCPLKTLPVSGTSAHSLPFSPFHFQASPFDASIALVHGVFAMAFSPGPEKKPYDKLKGYATVNGITNIVNSTFADFGGSGSGCGVSAGAGMHPVWASLQALAFMTRARLPCGPTTALL